MATQLHEIEAEPFQQEEQHDIETEQEDCSDKRPFVNVSNSNSISILCSVLVVIVIHV